MYAGVPTAIPVCVRVSAAAALPRVVQREDVGVLETRRNLDFAEEALGAEVGGEIGMENLHGHWAMVLQVLSDVYGRHAPTTDFPLDGVALSQGLSETIQHA